MTPFGDVRVRQGRTLDEFEAPLTEVIGAAAGSAWNDNPTQQLMRLGEQADQSFGEPKKLDAEAARARLEEAGIKYTVPEDGIGEDWLNTVIKRRQEKAARDDVLRRAPSGSMPYQLAASWAASLFDPINIASAFVPVVGQARYAKMVASTSSVVGRAGVRAGVGAVEGAVGQAMLEPLTAYANSQEGIDYTMADAFRNIAFGGVFGGGLHVTGGALGDVMARRAARGEDVTDMPAVDTKAVGPAAQIAARLSPQVSEATMKTAIAQAATGRNIDVDAIVKLDPAAEAPKPVFGVEMATTHKGLDLKIETSKDPIARPATEQALYDMTLPKSDGDITLRATTPDGQVIGHLDLSVRPDGKTAEVRVVKVNPEYRRKGVATALQDAAQAKGYKIESTELVTDDGRAFQDAYEARPVPNPTRNLDPLRRAAEANQRPEAAQGVDFEASKRADQQLADAPKTEDLALATEEARLAEQDLTEAVEQLGGDAGKMLEKYNDDVKRANAYAKAARVAAVCNLRT